MSWKASLGRSVLVRMIFRLMLIMALLSRLTSADALLLAGTSGLVGTFDNPKRVNRLEIDKPGVYENYLIDAQGRGGNIVKITADGVTLRNCEIYNGSGNGVGVFGTRVLIENCRIHHLLAGTFEEQHDAHGITGRWGDVTIRNCDISMTSGDCIQFDPDRRSTGSLKIENCRLWTGKLEADAPGFKAGQSPGENAFDSKTAPDGERCKLVIRQCHMYGWSQPSQIQNRAALNLKERVDAEVSHCVFENCEIAIRARGPGSRGGARVQVSHCSVYRTVVAVRAEDRIEQLQLTGMGYAPDVERRIEFHNGKDLPGYQSEGEREAPLTPPVSVRHAAE